MLKNKNTWLLHPHSEILCGAAVPGFFFQEKHVPGVLVVVVVVRDELGKEKVPGSKYQET